MRLWMARILETFGFNLGYKAVMQMKGTMITWEGTQIIGSEEDIKQLIGALEWLKACTPTAIRRLSCNLTKILCAEGADTVILPAIGSMIINAKEVHRFNAERMANRIVKAFSYIEECRVKRQYRTYHL